MIDRYRWNLHVHSTRSGCAKPDMVPADIMAEAARLGYEAIAITDHVDLGSEAELARLAANKAELPRLASPVRLLVGVETTVLSPNRVSLPREAARGLDFVMASANHYHLDCVEQPPSLRPADAAAHCLAMTEGAIESGYVDVIAHPLLRGVVPLPAPELIRGYWQAGVSRMLDKAAAAGVGLELNPGMVARQPEFFAWLIALAQTAGARFTLGTDAHRLVNMPYPEAMPPAGLAALGLRAADLLRPEELAGRRSS